MDSGEQDCGKQVPKLKTISFAPGLKSKIIDVFIYSLIQSLKGWTAQNIYDEFKRYLLTLALSFVFAVSVSVSKLEIL